MNPLLKNRRSQLGECNQKILKAFLQRRNIVRAITHLKGGDPQFDPTREWEFYQSSSMKRFLGRFTLAELLAFSLLMEDHASQRNAELPSNLRYPAWSKQVHLKRHKSAGLLWPMINPLLLASYYPKLFKKLSLKEKYRFLKNPPL